jgi:multicomponent Na+:H+ antiporter subunit B
MKEMSKNIKKILGIIFPFVIIYGLIIVAVGHLIPGGGFLGGAIIASGLVMMLGVKGTDWTLSKITVHTLIIFVNIGALVFIGLGFIGIIFGEVFFSNILAGTANIFGSIPINGAFDINSGGLIPLMSIAVGLMVAAGLFAIVLIMAHAIKEKEGAK